MQFLNKDEISDVIGAEACLSVLYKKLTLSNQQENKQIAWDLLKNTLSENYECAESEVINNIKTIINERFPNDKAEIVNNELLGTVYLKIPSKNIILRTLRDRNLNQLGY